MADKKADILEKASAREFLNELSKKIKKYEKKSLNEIPTCDVQDVWIWIRKTEEKIIKNYGN